MQIVPQIKTGERIGSALIGVAVLAYALLGLEHTTQRIIFSVLGIILIGGGLWGT
ncbi:MAG: hypothetical protein AB7N71_06675 [Phycisphaerae bacterium]